MIGIFNTTYTTNSNKITRNVQSSTETFSEPPSPPMNGATLQHYNVRRNLFINVTPENDGTVTVDVISPKNHEILEHHSINPTDVQPSNASLIEMLALDQYLVSQGESENVLANFISILYENEDLNERANHLEELKYSADNDLKYNSFEVHLKNRQATYAILDWKPHKLKS
ncbi:MAG: hypothetical protein VZR06_00660 [Butyrivibrio sp.]|nr:hypothetical protein [Butyrivibrio sp.]